MILNDMDVDRLLAEDVPYGDLTTEALGISDRPGRLTMAARGDMVICCVEEAAGLLQRLGAAVSRSVASGDRIPAGEAFLVAEGPAGVLHRGWRVGGNLIEYASGIASATRQIVDAATAVQPDIVIECTRKHLPGTRAMAVRAVRAGGGQMHRLGLSETFLIFPQHRAFMPDPAAMAETVARLKRQHPGKKVTAEAWSVEEGIRLAEAGVDIIQLDKLPSADVRRVVESTRHLVPAPAIAATGGVNAGNAAEYAATGCQLLVTSSPYLARPKDVRITIDPA